MWFHRFPKAKDGRNPAPRLWLRKDWKQFPKDGATGRSKKRLGNCAAGSINCKRRLKSRAAILKPPEKKRQPSTRIWRKQAPSSRTHKRKSRRRGSQNVRHAINSRRHRHRSKRFSHRKKMAL